MNQQPLCNPSELAAAVPDGAKLVVPSDNCGVAMAAARDIVRRGVRAVERAAGRDPERLCATRI